MNHQRPGTPLLRRPYDLALCLVALGFACISWTVDALLAFRIPLHEQSPRSLPGLFLSFYAARADPLLVENPPFIQVQATICVFVFGPFYLVLAYALLRERSWIRIPALMFGATALYCIAIVLGVNLSAGYSPPAAALFWVGNLPYVIFPLALCWRMRGPEPFPEREPLAQHRGGLASSEQGLSVE